MRLERRSRADENLNRFPVTARSRHDPARPGGRSPPRGLQGAAEALRAVARLRASAAARWGAGLYRHDLREPAARVSGDAEKELLIFEQHLYLRQPGYGTSYVTGKYLLERTLAGYAKQLEESGDPFKLRDFFDRLNRIDSIPIALGRWEMTGLDDELRAIGGE